MGISVASRVALTSTAPRSNCNLRMLVFVEGGKPDNPEKNPQSRDDNKHKKIMTSTPGIKPGPHWWEASAHHCAIPAPPEKCLTTKTIIYYMYVIDV